ncbi:hypothetical protein H0H92_014441 [Tricholoma furcatifolium]|nr:hypothetical protein H0H92_014441 [Tricholoma furcatifolium]
MTFNKLLLISCICIVVALILYFFHWNRFIAFLIGLGFRITYWNEEVSSIRVEIGSIHFSMIAGRILLKDVSYHSSNQTIKILKAQVQWRYWIRQPTSADDIGLRGVEDQDLSPELQCRIHISVHGLEWFIYNRTAAFDSIISQMETKNPSRTTSRSTERRQALHRASTQASSTQFYTSSSLRPSFRVPRRLQKALAWVKGQLPSLDPKDLLPLGIEITKGAITCGNNSTPTLLVAEFRRSEGSFGLVNNLWKRLRLLALAKKYTQDRRDVHAMQRQGRPKSRKKGTSDDVNSLGADFKHLEYAIERKILETPLLEISYFFDVVGEVPEHSGLADQAGVQSIDIDNGDVAPDWGFDIIINGGVLHYGPWSDRQRVELQRVFFPPTYQDVEITSPPKPGDKRLWTAMTVFVELRDNTILHIPFREPSKDWQWDGLSDNPQKSRVREATSIQVTVGDSSSISYTLPMVASSSGYRPVLEVHLDTVVITSSLNDMQMVTSESCRIHCEMPTPLRWNQEREWITTLAFRQPVLYLIRDHINMFIDLGKDWTTGPPSDYQRFIPMIYTFEMTLHHYALNLYVNDHNIIDKPLIHDENALLTLQGALLRTSTKILSNEFRPECTKIPFTVNVPDPSLSLSLPRWNINALHAPKEGNSLANVRSLHVEGSYQYFAEVSEDFVEQLKLRFELQEVAFKNVGWSIRYFMILKDNYLGNFTHFSTLYEYLDRRGRNQPLGDPVLSKYRPGNNNMLQSEIQVFVDGGTIIMPTGLPGYSSSYEGNEGSIGDCLIATIPRLQLQFRMHDHFMGLDITANRLFGPQPRTATYICIWEINLGAVNALLTASQGRLLGAAGNAFMFNFTDALNAPASEYQPLIDPDVTFLKLSLKSLDITWRAGSAALVVNLPRGVKMDSNDLGGRYHRKTTGLRVAEICVKILLSSHPHTERWLEAMNFSADAYLDIYSAPRNYRLKARDQIAFVEEQDRFTGRAGLLVASLRTPNAREVPKIMPHKNGVYLPQPRLAERVQHAVSAASAQARLSTLRKPQRSVIQHSDSDAEEGISEADRDARLAKTRSSTPVPRSTYEDNRNMSSGDESDDEDLTDASSDSDWSDLEGDIDSTKDSTLRHYSDITRHYRTRFLESPDLWEGCPFVLVRDCPQLSSSKENGLWGEGESQPTTRVSDDSEDCTYLRLTGVKPVTLKVTPLVLQAAALFELDSKKNTPCPELHLDDMVIEHLRQMCSSQAKSSTHFDVSIPSLTVQLLHRIMTADGHPIVSHVPPKTKDSSVLDAIAVIHANFHRISICGLMAKHCFSVDTRIGWSSLTLDVSLDRKTIQPASPDNFVFDYDIKDFRFSFGEKSLAIEWGQSTFRVGHLGPEYTVAAGLALTHSIAQLTNLLQNWKQFSSSFKQSVVSDIIRYSGDRAAVDPLSTIQPSYLVQSGIPHRLRTDTTFRFLYHLRDCLWHLQSHERGIVGSGQNKTQNVDRDNLIQSLETRLVALDPDSYSLSSLGPFFPMLELGDPSITSASYTPVVSRSLSFRFSRLAVVVLDPTNAAPSELVIADVDVGIRILADDVLQLPSLNHTSMSQTSLRETRPQNILKSSALVHFGDISLTVSPHLMVFAQHVLRVRRHLSASSPIQSVPSSSLSSASRSSQIPKIVCNDLLFSLGHFRIQAAAENLIFEFGISEIRGASSLMLQPRPSEVRSMNLSILFNEIFIRARSPSKATKQDVQDILASLELLSGRISTVLRGEPTAKAKVRLIFSVKDVQLLVPRSALRLYRFIQEWRADFLPGIEATVQALLSEIQRTPAKSTSPSLHRSSSGYPSFQIQGELCHAGIALQVMHGTWLSWEANNATAHLGSSTTPIAGYIFGLQIVSVILSISSRPNARDEEPRTRVKLGLPPLSATGRYDASGIHTLVMIDFADLKVKPSYWDTLLVVQQKFGQDFHDLVTLVQETNVRKAPSKKPKMTQNPLTYSVFVKMRGFRIGLEGPASTVYFECLDIGGGINDSSGLKWNVELSDLAFSLASRGAARPNYAGFNRSHCSAFVIIDFKVEGCNQLVGDASSTVVQVSVTKMHAVAQPSSIGEAEMLDRKEQRASELAAFKEKTRRILETFEVGAQDTLADTRPWLQSYIINVATRNIGVAFPLTHDQDLQLPRTGSRDSTAVPAVLLSIKSIEFGTHRGLTGQAEMKLFSFQFVSRFRQSIHDDFSGENHITRNRLIYPEMKAQLRSTHSAALRHIHVQADVSGFILDLDSSMPSYVFSLIDVYRQGKDRMEKISNSLPRTPSALEGDDVEKELKVESPRTALPTSNLFASFTFLSGKVRLYSGAASRLYRTRAHPYSQQELSDEQVMEIGAEAFNLPVVSVWTEYRAAPISQKTNALGHPEPSILMFKSTVHSSQNTLRPTLLPFLTELVNHIEARLRRISLQAPPTPALAGNSTMSNQTQNLVDPTSTLRVSFSLRIDQSKLELTCQPDVNVIAGLHWDSGGFVVNVSPGARKVTFTGCVGGLTLGLKHGFLSEDCVRLDARNLAFSVAFAKVDDDVGILGNFVSLVLDTEFLGVVRFSRLQDILCFKAVWLDRIPVFNSPPVPITAKTSTQTSGSTTSIPRASKQHFTTIILIRIRGITLEADLGQSISIMTLDLKDAVMRTKLTEIVSELSVFVDSLAITAKGNVAGHAYVSKCIFETIRGSEDSMTSERRNQMLQLNMTSGPLVISLESDHQKLLHYRAEPLEVKIFDDWSSTAQRTRSETKPLQLSFTVRSPDIVAVATVATIPKLLAYINKFRANLDAQRLGASRESKAFRITRTPKPDNPLSAVAEAMLTSARSRFKEAENELNYVIMQHMSLELDFLRLVVFPRTMDDLEIAQFIGRDVKARLNRLVESEPAAGKRDLLLSFSSMIISKFTGLGHPQTSALSDGREWLASLLRGASEATIVGLPSMTMHMISEEQVEGSVTTLVYDFHSEFVRQEDEREYQDIYITLNVALYSWLTVLRKNLTREMEQVKASTDWRALLNTSSTQGGQKKKPPPEPLNIVVTSPQSSTMPSPAQRPFSPFSPTTALKSSMGGPAGLLSPTSSTLSTPRGLSPGLQDFPSIQSQAAMLKKPSEIVYQPRTRHIERLTMRQLGEATPDVMHPFFMKKAGFNLEDALPQYVNEYATRPLEEIMEALLKIYSRQLLSSIQ